MTKRPDGARRVAATYPRRPPETIDALLRAKLHIAGMLEAGVTLQWIGRTSGISRRRMISFTSGSSIHRYDGAFAEAVLALSPVEGVAASSGMAVSLIERWGPHNADRAVAMRDEVARDLEDERARRMAMATRAMLPLPSVARLSPRRTLVVGVDDRPAPGEIRSASETLDAMRAAGRLPMRRVLRPSADVAKARGRASVWLPVAADVEAAHPAAARPGPTEAAEPPAPPVLLVRSVPGSPRSRVRDGDRISMALAEALCDGDVDGLWDVCLRTSDLALADLADLADLDLHEVAQWRAAAMMPAARCRTCRDRLVAPGRRSMCDLCAFEAHDRMARRVRHGVPDPPQRIPEAPWPDASMPRAVPARAHIPAPRPSAERCGRCSGALGVRREVCGACAFDLFMEAAERARADGVPVE